MNIKKRDVIISLILSVVFGLLVLCAFTEVLGANELICTEPVVEETTLCTTEPTDAIEETTEPSDFKIEDILFDKNLCFIVLSPCRVCNCALIDNFAFESGTNATDKV